MTKGLAWVHEMSRTDQGLEWTQNIAPNDETGLHPELIQRIHFLMKTLHFKTFLIKSSEEKLGHVDGLLS